MSCDWRMPAGQNRNWGSICWPTLISNCSGPVWNNIQFTDLSDPHPWPIPTWGTYPWPCGYGYGVGYRRGRPLLILQDIHTHNPPCVHTYVIPMQLPTTCMSFSQKGNPKVQKISSEGLPKLEEIDDDEKEEVVRKISFKPLDFWIERVSWCKLFLPSCVQIYL